MWGEIKIWPRSGSIFIGFWRFWCRWKAEIESFPTAPKSSKSDKYRPHSWPYFDFIPNSFFASDLLRKVQPWFFCPKKIVIFFVEKKRESNPIQQKNADRFCWKMTFFSTKTTFLLEKMPSTIFEIFPNHSTKIWTEFFRVKLCQQFFWPKKR